MFLLWIDQMMAGARRNAGCWSKNRPNTQGHDGAGDGDEDGADEKKRATNDHDGQGQRHQTYDNQI